MEAVIRYVETRRRMQVQFRLLAVEALFDTWLQELRGF
jgi:hypothetical protein